MRHLFDRCYNADYIRTAESGDYAIEVEGGTIYLLFQWSNGREDWRNNFDFPAKAYKHTEVTWRVHRGFLRVWKAMRDDIEQKVATIMAEQHVERIVCVGYSHGAALALLATEDMEYHHGQTVSVEGWGFGAPRVLWGRVPEAIRYRLRHFTPVRNIPDIVTHLPPAVFGFKHVNLLRVGKPRKYNIIDAHRPEAYQAELQHVEKQTNTKEVTPSWGH